MIWNQCTHDALCKTVSNEDNSGSGFIIKRKARIGVCTGCWEIRESVPQCLASCPLPWIHTPCDWVPGALKSACRPFQTRTAKSNQLCWNNGSWTMCPNLFTYWSLLPPSAGWLDFRSRSTSVLAIQCHLRSWIPMHESHFFSQNFLGFPTQTQDIRME